MARALNIQPFQFEPLPGTSSKRGRPSIHNTKDVDAHDNDGGDSSDQIWKELVTLTGKFLRQLCSVKIIIALLIFTHSLYF